MKIIVFAAFKKEVHALVEALGFSRPFETADSGLRWTSGEAMGHEIIAAVTGMGRQRALSAGRSALDHFDPDRILVTGAAGALAPTVGPLDLVVAERICAWSADSERPAWTNLDNDAAEGLLRACTAVEAAGRGKAGPVHHGGMVTVEQPLLDAAIRERLWILTLGQAVDMETAFLVQEAASMAVPAGVVKVVTDLADRGAMKAFRRNIDAAAEKIMRVVIRYIEKGVPFP
jgi:adenosylhomocysteine nucleosidase